MTRQQQMMSRAIAHVRDLETMTQPLETDSNDVKKAKKALRKKYGGLCHNFPVMILQCGLCQAVAFNASKAKDTGKARAHKLILNHAQRQLGINPVTSPPFAATVADWSTQEYVLNTRLLLQAFAFYKRFAESILHVEQGDPDDDDDVETPETEAAHV